MRDSLLKPQWFQILLALADKDLHGLGIQREVLSQTDDKMRLWPRMLYGSLQSLSEAGWIEEREGPDAPGLEEDRRRFYGLTEAGRERLAEETRRLESYLRLAQERRVLGAEGGLPEAEQG
ncbi:MAG TPA: helix-turn-helix transcriptional regulator [Acidobacteriota bacterium]|nr:helix-turn-helix transcriptional regulator [Acidobacteriota bacterium]